MSSVPRCTPPGSWIHPLGDGLGQGRQIRPPRGRSEGDRRSDPRHAQGLGSEEDSIKRESQLTPKGAKIVAAPKRFRDTIEAGIPIEERYTVRRVKLNLMPQAFGPEEVKRVRATLGVSQPIFGQFLGVDVKTVRSWEQGRRVPSGMARRFLEEIQAAPEHWRGRLHQVMSLEG
jgi:putative transcriptional regulator